MHLQGSYTTEFPPEFPLWSYFVPAYCLSEAVLRRLLSRWPFLLPVAVAAITIVFAIGESALPHDVLPRAVLPRAVLPRAVLPRAVLPHAVLPHAVLPHAVLPRAVLSHTVLSRTFWLLLVHTVLPTDVFSHTVPCSGCYDGKQVRVSQNPITNPSQTHHKLITNQANLQVKGTSDIAGATCWLNKDEPSMTTPLYTPPQPRVYAPVLRTRPQPRVYAIIWTPRADELMLYTHEAVVVVSSCCCCG